MSRISFKPIDPQIVTFFAIACAIAWPIAFVFGVDETAIRAEHGRIASILIIYVPKFAFAISGLIMFRATGKTKRLVSRISRWDVAWYWYVIAYLGPALLYFISAWASNSIWGTETLYPEFAFPGTIVTLLVGSQTGIIVYFLFRGGLGEEIGLRAFALERLQERRTPFGASLMLGFWWGLWHVPAWLGRPVFEIFIVWMGVMAFSFLFTTVYNETRSLPIVMLLHASLNSFDDVIETLFPALKEMSWEVPYLTMVIIIGIVLSLVMVWRQSESKPEPRMLPR